MDPAGEQPDVGAATAYRPIVYGSVATPIKKPETEHTHKWTVFVRGFNNEDISYYVRRVVFKLHESFAEPTRTIEKHPFEVHETGWGEFQIQIKIVFQDPNQRPVTIAHQLRLYPPEDLGQLKTSRSVVSEHYDEIVFDPPSETMMAILRQNESKSDPAKGPRRLERNHCDDKPSLLVKQMEDAELQLIDSAIAKVKQQLADIQTQLNERPRLVPVPEEEVVLTKRPKKRK